MTDGPIVRASTAADGTQADFGGSEPGLSADGGHVAFSSFASNLAPDDTNGASDIFVKDLDTGEIALASAAADGTQANGTSRFPNLSADGGTVLFQSRADNLVPNDTNRQAEIFVKDLDTGSIVLANTAADGKTVSIYDYLPPSFSEDGRYAAFGSGASIYVKDLDTGALVDAHAAADGTLGNDNRARNPSLSADGRAVAFESPASNLVPDDTNGRQDIFVKDLDTGAIVRASIAADGTETNAWSYNAALSGDGGAVAFQTLANSLVPNDTNGKSDIFVKDLNSGAVVRASTAASGTQANGESSNASLSNDGRFVAFESIAGNLVPDDSNGRRDIFVKDLETGAIVRVSTAADGTEGNGQSFSPDISADGSSVSFESDATNLVPGDTNGSRDVFVKDLSDVWGVSLAGTPGDDALSGTKNNDTIGGLGGNDSLDGLAGNDSLLGDDGADSLLGGSGFDVLAGGDGEDLLDGGEGNDTLNGDDGDDTLFGGLGSDTLDGGDGDDRLIGESRVDCVQVQFESEDAGFRSTYGAYDIVTGQANILVANVDTVTNPGIEAFTATLCLTADEFDRLGFFLIPDGFDLNADAGEPLGDGDATALDLDVINDGGLWRIRDTDSGHVFQGAGSPAYFTEMAKNPGGLDHVREEGDPVADGAVTYGWEDLPDLGDRDFDDVVFRLLLAENAGDGDSLVGGEGDDTLSFEGTLQGVSVDLAAGTATGTWTGEDSLRGIENVTGGGGDDTLSGDDNANILDGGGGDDSLVWDDGNDTYAGGEGNDTLSFEGTVDGVTVDLGAGAAAGTETGEDDLSGVENIVGGDGDDRLSGDGGNNGLVGGGGNDTLSFENDTAGVTVDLLGGNAFGNASGVDTVADFENVTGGGGNDTLSGDHGPNGLEGGSGRDILRGRVGNDTLMGGDGDDTLIGGDGLDSQFGGEGNDVFDFASVWESPPNPGRDVIGDFADPGPGGGDVIDVSDIAAFAFIGTDPFSSGGAELRVEQSGADTLVMGDVDGDGVADFEIQVNTSTAADFTEEDFWLA